MSEEYKSEQRILIDEALASPDWTESEKCVVKWQFKLYGSFYASLFETMTHADWINIEKLRQAFPVEVEGFLAWRDGVLGEKIDEAIGL